MGNRDVIEEWFHKVWTEEDAGTIDRLLVSDSNVRGLGERTRIGPEEFKVFHAGLLAMVGDARVDIEKFMEDGEWASALCTFRAKRRDNGGDVSISGQVMLQVRDGKIVDAYNHFDFIDLFDQIGLLPDRLMERCMSGEKIG